MRHRIAFCVASAVAVTAGCAGVLGLEDRHLESEAAPATDGDTVADDGTTSDVSSPSDAAFDALPDSPCVFSTPVYEFESGVGGRGYVINRDDAPPATFTQRSFGLLDPRVAVGNSSVFTAQRNDAGDYVVTSRRDAEADGYEPFEQLANIGDDLGDAAPPLGMIVLERFHSDAGDAHRFIRDGESKDGWQTDVHRWWACP